MFKVSVNLRWGGQKSTMAGAYILAVASKLLARTGSQEVSLYLQTRAALKIVDLTILDQVVEILSQVLADLVQGEFQQLQTKQDEEDRCKFFLFQLFQSHSS